MIQTLVFLLEVALGMAACVGIVTLGVLLAFKILDSDQGED